MSRNNSEAGEQPADHHQARLAKLEAWRGKGVGGYELGYERTHSLEELSRLHGELPPEGQADGEVRVAGRILTLRRHGKLAFADLKDATGGIQLLADEEGLGDKFEDFTTLDPGDWVGATGQVIKTRRGELTVKVDRFELLSKSLRPLPEKWHGLKDVELRYRQRYLDLIANPEAREVLQNRARAVSTIRSWLTDRGFIEVETPMLQPIPGGALAQPFVTFHEALGMELYLRIAPELYLKRLLVGGVEKVFEINRSFRNEGISVRHNPEFTMLELYEALGDYEAMARLLEEMIRAVCLASSGGLRLPYQGEELDFESPFRRARLIDLVAEAGVDVEADLGSECERLGIAFDPKWPWGKLLLEIYEKKVERSLVQPTFVMDFPKEVSPLARQHRSDSRFTEHLDLVIAGMEIGVAYSELTDPLEQRKRFEAQLATRDSKGEVAPVIDEDFLTALEYGMPPAGGLGLGIDRLTMVLTDQASIREVILFPALRPEKLSSD
ncbi:MAG: lysine--tRNA ligase [Actinomycetota bacterium]